MSVPWPDFTPQQPPIAQQMLLYLDQLGTWITDSRRELDRCDQKIQATGNSNGVHDIAMTLTVWQTIQHRYTDLTRTWDSGRVGENELKRLAVMVWANLNDMLTPGTTLSTGGGLALSLPEACRMLEALISQLNSRYQLAPVPTQVSARIAALLAQIDRIREQAGLDPPEIRADRAVEDLSRDVKDLIEKADRGGDVGGILGPIEVRAAQLERDLIVGHTERRMMNQRLAQANARRDGLIARTQMITDLVARTHASLSPAPKYAIPRVESLGQIPTTSPELEAYLLQLNQVSAALDIVQQANEKAIGLKRGLQARFEQADAMVSDDLGRNLGDQIRELLNRSPAPLDIIEPLLNAFEASRRQS